MNEGQQPRFLEVSVDTVNKIMQYLSKQPWAEVNGLIGELSQSRPVAEYTPEKED